MSTVIILQDIYNYNRGSLAPQSHKATPAQVAANKYFRNIKVVLRNSGGYKKRRPRGKGGQRNSQVALFL